MFQILLPLERLDIGRGEFIAQMHARGIGVGVHYPAMHLFKLFRGLGYGDGDFPHAEARRRESRHPAAVPEDGGSGRGPGVRRGA